MLSKSFCRPGLLFLFVLVHDFSSRISLGRSVFSVHTHTHTHVSCKRIVWFVIFQKCRETKKKKRKRKDFLSAKFRTKEKDTLAFGTRMMPRCNVSISSNLIPSAAIEFSRELLFAVSVYFTGHITYSSYALRRIRTSRVKSDSSSIVYNMNYAGIHEFAASKTRQKRFYKNDV